MHISCEQCATTYVLDERLIPPAGASVQCTKCGHVFLAKPPEAAAPPPPAPAARPASQTMVFGAKAAQDVGMPQRPAVNPNERVAMGPGGAVNLPPLGQPPASRGSQTMVFGAADAGAIPSAAVAKANATMVFGAASANVVPEKPAPKANATMVFGAASGAIPEKVAAKANATMVFGAVAGAPEKAAPKPNNATMVFGQGFGGGDAASSASPGRPGPADPRSPPSTGQGTASRPANSTMVFGAPAVPPPGAVVSRSPSATLPFGAAAVGAVPSAKPSAPRPNSTMVFGALAAPSAEGSPADGGAGQSGRTMLFARPPEQPEAEEPTAAQSGSTKLFGAPGAGSSPTSAPNSTVIFGAAEARAQPSKLTESTVRIGMDDLQRMMKDHRARRGEEITPAQSEGAEPAARDNKTQLFALSDVVDPQTGATAAAVVTPSDGRQAVEARHDRTQLFARPEADIQSTLPPDDEESKPAPVARSRAPRDPSIFETLPPNEAPARLDLGQRVDLQPPTPSLPLSFQGTLQDEDSPQLQPLARMTTPNLDPIDRPRVEAPVELPPENDLPSMLQTGPVDAQGDAAYAELAERQSRRGRLVLVLLLVALVIAIGAVAWKLFGAKLMGSQAPAEAIEGTAQALATLRKDSTADKRAAIESLTLLVSTYPDFVEAHAGLVTALSLEVDDLNQRSNRLAEVYDLSKRDAESPDAEKASAARAKLEKLHAEHDGMIAQNRALNAKLTAAWDSMGAAQQKALSRHETLAVLRAQALRLAVNGDSKTIELATRYRATAAEDADADVWAALAIPEYVANTATSEKLVDEALEILKGLEKQDPTFLRVAVLKARLLARDKDYRGAEVELERVITLTNSGHDLAAEMLKAVTAKRQQAEDKNPQTPRP